MKLIIYIAAAISLLTSMTAEAQQVPPLRITHDIDSTSWSAYSLPQVFTALYPTEEEHKATQQERNAEIAAEIADYAAQFIGRRYRLGSTGPKTFDCSGFMSYIFKNSGIDLNRTSKMQYTQGETVDRDNLKPGDLMFFSSPRSGRGKVGHVAMVVDVDTINGECTFIHASSSKGVSYQKFPDGGYFSRNYIGAKRVITEA